VHESLVKKGVNPYSEQEKNATTQIPLSSFHLTNVPLDSKRLIVAKRGVFLVFIHSIIFRIQKVL